MHINLIETDIYGKTRLALHALSSSGILKRPYAIIVDAHHSQSVAAARQEVFGSHPVPGSSDLISSRPSNKVFETFTDVSIPCWCQHRRYMTV